MSVGTTENEEIDPCLRRGDEALMLIGSPMQLKSSEHHEPQRKTPPKGGAHHPDVATTQALTSQLAHQPLAATLLPGNSVQEPRFSPPP